MEFKIIIESWEAYNNGYLLGEWHDVSDLDLEEFGELMAKVQREQKAKLNKLLNWSHSNCEELFAPDFECDLPIKYIESGLISMFKEFLELKELLEHESEETIKLAQAIKESEGFDSISETLERAQGAIELDQTSESGSHYDLAYYLMESTGDLDSLPDFAQRYFDYESFGRDLVLGGDYSIYNIEGTAYAVSSY